MVIHEPGDWLVESLRGLGAQTYESLQCLLLVSGREDAPEATPILDMVKTELPNAVVRFLGSNPGYAGACNTVLNLVQGDSGFFCFLHDDIVLASHAISELVDELYRSNAGVVAPKIVHWDDPRMIQSVGTAIDRFGVELAYADVGELDQEQHDAVQDVFVVSGACVLVRADLFRTVNGFNADLPLVGSDTDFCWRCHTTGARVVVVPSAVARHREAMSDRLGEVLPEDVQSEAEHVRVRTVVALTPPSQLPLTILQMLLLVLVRAVLLLGTGRASRAVTEVKAFISLPASLGSIRKRRDDVSKYRTVSGEEVRALQLRGSAYVTGYLRQRARKEGLAQAQVADIVKESPPRSAFVLWATLIVVLLVGSRSLIADGVASVGQMSPFGGSARDLLRSYVSGWWGAGFGQVSALPTGIALTAVAGAGALGNMGLLHTLAVVLLPFIGWTGVWRFASVLGTRAARIAAVTAYAAVPLPYSLIASGRWGALLLYALVPWMVHLTRMLVGFADLSPLRDTETIVMVASSTWRRWFAGLSLLTAIGLAFEPGILLVFPFIAVLFFISSFTHGLHIKWSSRWLAVVAGAVVVAIMLNLPWAATYVRDGWWEAIVGAPVESGRNVGLWGLLTFSVGDFTLSSVSVFLFVAVAGSIILVRGPRTGWALRGATLTVGALLIAILDDSALLPAHLAEPGVMLVPVAFGIAICAGTLGASLQVDLRRGKFSWRQPLGALVAIAFSVGLFPASINAIGGDWHQPSLTLPQLLAQLPNTSTDGDYRTMYIGDPRVLPGAPLNFGWGISYSILNGPLPNTDEQWETPPTRAREDAVSAMYGIVRGKTSRAGRLLAPLAVRFVVVPVIDGGQSTRDNPIAVPKGLIDALSRQLDLRRKFASPDLVVFENSAWVPVRSVLSSNGAASSKLAGATSMITSNIGGGISLPDVDRPEDSVTAKVEAGSTIHLSVPYTPRWKVDANGVRVTPRPAFGLTNAYDVPAAGDVRLWFETSTLHFVLVFVQIVAWCVLFVMSVSRRRFRSRTTAVQVVASTDGPVILMDQGGAS